MSDDNDEGVEVEFEDRDFVESAVGGIDVSTEDDGVVCGKKHYTFFFAEGNRRITWLP